MTRKVAMTQQMSWMIPKVCVHVFICVYVYINTYINTYVMQPDVGEEADRSATDAPLLFYALLRCTQLLAVLVLLTIC